MPGSIRQRSNMHILAKERSGFGSSEDPKFSGEWRRQGPLPDLGSRDSSRRRHDGPPADRQSAAPSVSDTSNDWRSNRPTRAPPPSESEAGPRRKGSGFVSEGAGAADKEETWTIGGKFKPSEDDGPGRKFGSFRGRGDMGPPSSVPDSPAEGGDWRSGPRPGLSSRNSTSRESCSSSPLGPSFTRGM
jgi:translation initiation factor 4B